MRPLIIILLMLAAGYLCGCASLGSSEQQSDKDPYVRGAMSYTEQEPEIRANNAWYRSMRGYKRDKSIENDDPAYP